MRRVPVRRDHSERTAVARTKRGRLHGPNTATPIFLQIRRARRERARLHAADQHAPVVTERYTAGTAAVSRDALPECRRIGMDASPAEQRQRVTIRREHL